MLYVKDEYISKKHRCLIPFNTFSRDSEHKQSREAKEVLVVDNGTKEMK